MKFFAFLATIAVASARHIKIDEIDYGFCEGAAQPGTIDKVEVTPFPILLHTGEALTILAQLTLNEIVPAGAKVSLDIRKEGIPELPIPCLEITNEEGELLHIGSCEYTADHLLDRYSDFLCPDHVPEGQTCATPLNPGTYGGEPPIEVVIPEIPDILVDLIGAGTYQAQAKILLEDGSEMTCLYVRVEIA